MSARRSMEKRFVIWCIRWYQKILSPDQGIFRFVFFWEIRVWNVPLLFKLYDYGY